MKCFMRFSEGGSRDARSGAVECSLHLGRTGPSVTSPRRKIAGGSFAGHGPRQPPSPNVTLAELFPLPKVLPARTSSGLSELSLLNPEKGAAPDHRARPQPPALDPQSPVLWPKALSLAESAVSGRKRCPWPKALSLAESAVPGRKRCLWPKA